MDWNSTAAGISFKGVAAETPVPLQMRLDEGRAELRGDDVWLSHAELAQLEPWELQVLDLPPAAPVRVEIRGEGTLSSPAFKLHCQLRSHDNRRLMGVKRNGAILSRGSKQHVLLDPLYSVVEEAERFQNHPPNDMDSRFLAWAKLKRLLPEDARVDDHLQTVNLVRADGYTLDVRPDGSFDPVPLSRPHSLEGADAEEQPLPAEPLPDAHQAVFADRFRRLPDANGHYALGGGWYMLVPERTRQALSVARRKQQADAAERRAFIANPHAAIREALRDETSEAELEQLFVEMPQFLSARVQCLGEWHPKLCAYLPPSKQQWLPEEGEAFLGDTEVGTVVDGSYMSFRLDQAPEIVQSIQGAVDAGQAAVEVAGQRIQANEGNLEHFKRFVTGGEAGGRLADPQDQGKPAKPLVPVLIDNLEDLGYVAERRTTRGEPGGLPANLKTKTLYPHQQQGLSWLQEHWGAGSPGALLADDMGLGKTLQTLAFLAWLQEQMDAGVHPRKPFLIVAPTGLLKNWEAESGKHLMAPGLGSLLRAFGKDLRELAEAGLRQRTKRLQEAEWVLTTYETLRDKVNVFLPVDWAVVAFDEVQKIKNPRSRMTEMAKSLKTDFTLALTGTPVENTLADLWSVMDACHPGLLGSLKEFNNRYQKPAEEEDQLDRGRELRAALEERVSPPALLRRMKEDHLQGLPEKQVHELELPMGQEQAGAYAGVVAQAAQAKGQRGAMLEILQKLRQVSLLLPGALKEQGLTDELVATSARLRATMEILEQIKVRGEKALIFVEYLDLQEALVVYLQQRFRLERPPLRISGKVAGAVRQRHVDDFQGRPDGEFDIMLLSPKAGGVGLTLTAANHVIHLSRWWNPAVEDQCTDRVFRIGQERTVHVYYPLAVHPSYGERSFDRNLHELLERKRALSTSVLAPPEVSDSEFGDLFANSCAPDSEPA